MPMPGSQQMNSIDFAYFLYTYRWYFRIVFVLMAFAGSFKAFQTDKKWIPAIAIIPVILIGYFFNFQMTADHMFLQPETLTFKGRTENTLSDSSVVIAVNHEGEAKAYPVRFIVYHHQVRDTIGGKPIMVTYCSVCRTGRVFEPVVNGKTENFRLVGMDHFNAMFEDATTGSWWRQATGEAITGRLKGSTLPEIESQQITLNKFFSNYPFGQVMQAEVDSKESYDTLGRFEKGKSKSDLTRTDSLSWKDKSWVVGIQLGNKTKAYDWNELKQTRLIHDQIDNTPVVIVLSNDDQSFAAYIRNTEGEKFIIRNDSLITDQHQYNFSGQGSNGSKLKRIAAYQEFWHSWKTFHPQTAVYSK